PRAGPASRRVATVPATPRASVDPSLLGTVPIMVGQRSGDAGESSMIGPGRRAWAGAGLALLLFAGQPGSAREATPVGPTDAGDDGLLVVATTSVLGDLVGRIVGPDGTVAVLMEA